MIDEQDMIRLTTDLLPTTELQRHNELMKKKCNLSSLAALYQLNCFLTGDDRLDKSEFYRNKKDRHCDLDRDNSRFEKFNNQLDPQYLLANLIEAVEMAHSKNLKSKIKDSERQNQVGALETKDAKDQFKLLEKWIHKLIDRFDMLNPYMISQYFYAAQLEIFEKAITPEIINQFKQRYKTEGMSDAQATEVAEHNGGIIVKIIMKALEDAQCTGHISGDEVSSTIARKIIEKLYVHNNNFNNNH